MEANRNPRHKSSLGKQFSDEVVSPLKKTHLKLDYSHDRVNQGMNKPVESLIQAQAIKYAAIN